MKVFSQSAYILLDQTPRSDDLDLLLQRLDFSVLKHEHGIDLLTAATASTVFEVLFPKDKSIVIDVVHGPWPDSAQQEDPVLLVSWHAGAFGRFAYPGCLERAVQECRAWPEAGEAVRQHSALLRLRVRCQHSGAPVTMNFADAFEELLTLTRILLALDSLPGVLGYFFPGGEALRSRGTLFEIWQYYQTNNHRPFDLCLLWVNQRRLKANEEPEWAILDTVGLHQLGGSDIEVFFSYRRYQPGQVVTWLWNIVFYLLERGPIIEDGNTLTGPGGINWQAHHYESSLQYPPRPVLCLRPLDSSTLPRRFLKRLASS